MEGGQRQRSHAKGIIITQPPHTYIPSLRGGAGGSAYAEEAIGSKDLLEPEAAAKKGEHQVHAPHSPEQSDGGDDGDDESCCFC